MKNVNFSWKSCFNKFSAYDNVKTTGYRISFLQTEHINYLSFSFRKLLLSPQFATALYKNLKLDEIGSCWFQRHKANFNLLQSSLHLEFFQHSWVCCQTLSDCLYLWSLLICQDSFAQLKSVLESSGKISLRTLQESS